MPSAHAQQARQRASIVFWNTENLYDTVPSPFYDDSDFTPQGENRWNTERYMTKIRNLARVLDELAADMVGLAEVENEEVVRDLVVAIDTDYNYIHRTSGDSRGIDQALLYKGDKFFPDPDGVKLARSGTGREFLHVTGELLGERVEIIVCHLASNLNSESYRRRNMQALRALSEEILAADPAANIIVMGDMNAVPGAKIVRRAFGDISSPWGFMYTPHWDHYRGRQGSYNYRGRWYLYDWMMVSPALSRTDPGAGRPGRQSGEHGGRIGVDAAGIYAKEYLTEPQGEGPSSPRKPLRTFYGGDYLGGWSDHFPVWITVVK